MSLLVSPFPDSPSLEPECRLGPGESLLPPARRGEHRCHLALRHAGEREVVIAWELVGPEDAPLLLLAGAAHGHRHVLANACDEHRGWWQAQAGVLGRYRVLAIDWLAGPLDSADQADALAAVHEALNLPVAAAFVGVSCGAMVGLQFAARHGGKIAQLVAISGGHCLPACTPSALHSHQLAPEAVRVPLSVIAIDSDRRVPREMLAELAVRAPDAWLQVIASRHGHDAFLEETTAIAAALKTALDN